MERIGAAGILQAGVCSILLLNGRRLFICANISGVLQCFVLYGSS